MIRKIKYSNFHVFQETHLKYRAVFHLIWLLFVTTSRVSSFGMPSSLAELEVCSNKASGGFAASESCLLVSLLGPITCIIISKAPVRGRVQYSSNGRSFFKANLTKVKKKYYRLIHKFHCLDLKLILSLKSIV